MHDIFISYRQEDTAGWAPMLREALVARFGADRVYLDKDNLGAGHWQEQIHDVLARSKVVLVLIGPRWLATRASDGQRRLDQPDDVHRWEIARALSTAGVTVIPVLVGRAAMPVADALPADIRALAATQWRELDDGAARREVDLARLVADIELAAGIAARLSAARSGWAQRIALLLASFVVAMVALGGLDTVLGWSALPFGEQVMVVVLLLGLALLVRRLLRGWRRRP